MSVLFSPLGAKKCFFETYENKFLYKDRKRDPRKVYWNYRQIIGMPIYLQGSTRPNISMATQQYARFTSNPKAPHERAVRYIVKYL